MAIHDRAFYFIVFFLFGVLFGSAVFDWDHRILVSLAAPIAIGAVFLIAHLVQKNDRRYPELIAFSFLIAFGAFYQFVYQAHVRNIQIPFENNVTVTGIIVDAKDGLERQTLVVNLEAPQKGRLRVTSNRYPAWSYGDKVKIIADIKAPSPEESARLSKDKIFAVTQFPNVELIAHGKGSSLKSMLLSIKAFAERAFVETLPPDQAAFLSGLTLGDTSAFPKELRDQMQSTGTTHLVALSGYNITLVAQAVVTAFAFLRSRKNRLALAVLAIVGFVAMTGAEASAVRAAIMASIVFFADHTRRRYSFRNAIVIAAFFMVIQNPMVLRSDVGFQLSFLAVLGLAYLREPLATFLHIDPMKPGFLKWREHMLATLAAQLAVLPILLSTFGQFSPISLITNVLVLSVVPLTMTLGFSIVGAAIFSKILAMALAWLTSLFAWYELGVIRFFAQFHLFEIKSGFTVPLAILYYAFLIGFIMYAKKQRNYELAI